MKRPAKSRAQFTFVVNLVWNDKSSFHVNVEWQRIWTSKVINGKRLVKLLNICEALNRYEATIANCTASEWYNAVHSFGRTMYKRISFADKYI